MEALVRNGLRKQKENKTKNERHKIADFLNPEKWNNFLELVFH